MMCPISNGYHNEPDILKKVDYVRYLVRVHNLLRNLNNLKVSTLRDDDELKCVLKKDGGGGCVWILRVVVFGEFVVESCFRSSDFETLNR